MSKTVLVVDDDVRMLAATRRQLERLGWSVRCTTEALEPGALPGADVVLADWQPHGRAAVALCRARGVPVVIYTGAPGLVPADIGCPVLSKPAGSDELAETLEMAIEFGWIK